MKAQGHDWPWVSGCCLCGFCIYLEVIFMPSMEQVEWLYYLLLLFYIPLVKSFFLVFCTPGKMKQNFPIFPHNWSSSIQAIAKWSSAVLSPAQASMLRSELHTINTPKNDLTNVLWRCNVRSQLLYFMPWPLKASMPYAIFITCITHVDSFLNLWVKFCTMQALYAGNSSQYWES